MNYILLVLLIIIDLFKIMIFIHIIFSWLNVIWVKFKIDFIDSILEPIYERIRNTIPTTIWPFDISPVILLLFIFFTQGLIKLYDIETFINYKNIINF